MRKLLIKGALELGVELSDAQVESFFVYLEELNKWNEKINLTSIVDVKEIISRHFLDSLALLSFVKDGERVLDMGSGAGFPGLALMIANPALRVTCMDKVEKKVRFMRHIIRTLGLSNAGALCARAGDEGVIAELSGSFDVVLSRAFSGIEAFLSLSLPYLKPGGRIVAVKGPLGAELREEIVGVAANKALSALTVMDTVEVCIPLGDRTSTVITFIAKA